MLRSLVVALLLSPSLLHADSRLTLYPNDGFLNVDPGQPAVVSGVVLNGTGRDVADARLHLDFPVDLKPQDPLVMNGWNCTAQTAALDCTRAIFEAGAQTQFHFTFLAPSSRNGGRFLVPLSLTAEGDPEGSRFEFTLFVSRQIFVRTTADSGPESLRAAIIDANANCSGITECKVYFDFPASQSAPVIDLLEPLPVVTASWLTIGAGDVRPFVELNGRQLHSGSGLVLRAATRRIKVQGMTIRRFPEHAIEIDESGAPVEYEIDDNALLDCFRGLDAVASQASLNVWRNVIGGNSRSGVAVWAASSAYFRDNFIGVSRSGEVLSNGASGIYISRNVKFASVSGGEIAFNYDFGVAVDRGTRNAAVWDVAIAENLAGDFDWGLDQVNPPHEEEDDGGPNPPLLLSATYDSATNMTTVSGELRGPTVRYGRYARVLLYASNMVRPSGVTPMTNMVNRFSDFLRVFDSSEVVTPFSMTFPGDYRSAYISGQTVIQDWPDYPLGATSELSRAVQAH